MTVHESIGVETGHLRALDRAAARACWLLDGREGPPPDLTDALEALGAAMGEPPALLVLRERFALSAQEIDALLIALAPDLGLDAAERVAEHPLAVQGCPTAAMVEHVLEGDPLHPDATLRRARLVELAPGLGLAERAVRADEAVLRFLRGRPALSAALAPHLIEVTPSEPPAWAPRLAEALMRARGRRAPPAIELDGASDGDAAAALALLGLRAFRLDPGEAEPSELAALIDRDMALVGGAVIAPASEAGTLVAERTSAPLVLIGPGTARPRRATARLTPEPETAAGREARWRAALGDAANEHSDELRAVARAFPLSAGAVADCAEAVATGLVSGPWESAKRAAAAPLDGLAERIEPRARWDDLVLPPPQRAQLEQLAAFQRRRATVIDDWGFREKSERGLGLAALFSGASGTGKTMAAEVVARSLAPAGGALDLFRIDLSAIVSKYIGETEKNIARVFDAAEASGGVLIFDEGDALFGKRVAETRDAVDRHANTETAYLLQRLEAYSGVAIVTTNLREAVDDAFLRRFRFVIDFPFPNAALRAEIWRRVIPNACPTEDLDFAALGRLSLTGGHIRAIALTAAFLAAEEEVALSMAHLRRAARQEYAKLGKTPTEAEIGLRAAKPAVRGAPR